MDENKNAITPEVTTVTPETPQIEDKGQSFDPEAFGADIMSQVEAKFPELVEKVSAKTREEIINKIIGDDKKEDNKPYVPGSYEELMEKTVGKAVEAFEKKQTEAQAKLEAEKTAQAEQEKKTIEANNEYWDAQLEDLSKDGLLPEIPAELAKKLADNIELTEEEQQDPSIQARAELYAKSKELKDKGDKDWWNFKYVAYKFGIGRGDKNAPVMFRNSYSQPGEHSAYSYEDIHGKSFQDIAKGK